MVISSTCGSTLAYVPTAPEILPTDTCLVASRSRSRPRLHLESPQPQHHAEGDGLGVNAMCAADHYGLAMLLGPALQDAAQPDGLLLQQRAGRLQLQGEPGVEHV